MPFQRLCWRLLLGDWLILSSGCGPVILDERTSMLLCLSITPLLVTITTLFMSSLGSDRSGWVKESIGMHIGSSVHMSIKILLC